jgi:mannose-1-phosphate guanylyltransferase/mannose-1-phosphate guanylyltransferase/mannose-6-phosphate isomerase
VAPVDHIIGDVDAFQSAVRAGLSAAENGAFVLFGIEPKTPDAGYGYIHMAASETDNNAIRKVLGFKEKPNPTMAERYVRSGEYAWNSGIFLLPAQRLLDELARLEPELLAACRKAVERSKSSAGFLNLDPEAFVEARNISIDYAVMENTDGIVVVPSSFDWSDIGTWSAQWDNAEKNPDGSVIIGNVTTCEAADCYIRSEGPMIAAVGIRDLIIVATQDAVLVTTKGREQDLKEIVERLNRAQVSQT